MAVERRFERDLRRSFREMQETLFPTGYLPEDPEIELARIRRAWEADQQLHDTISRALQDSADLGVSVAVDQLANVGYGFDWTLANVAARDWALRYTDNLLIQLGTTNERIAGQAVRRWFGNGEPLESLIQDLQPVFGRRRAELIAATETTRAAAEGTHHAYVQAGIIKQLIWRTARDERVCPTCGPLEGAVVGIEGSFFDQLPQEQQALLSRRANARFMRPPAHPACRCWISAAFDEVTV